MTSQQASVTQAITRAIAAVAPIDGVAFPDLTDKKSWRIDYQPSATDQHKAAAQAVIDGFDVNAPENQPPAPRDLNAEIDALRADSDALRAALIKRAVVTDQEITQEKIAPADLLIAQRG